VDLTQGMLRDLDHRAARLNVSRQAVIKTLLAGPFRETTSEEKGRLNPFVVARASNLGDKPAN
jgi:hypothetical protein